ncbi:cytochrome P450 [Melanogaster broomeanus]|nr:cytochrome P450 [Melanogaster broomeanus]
MSVISSDRGLIAAGIVAAASILTFLYNKYQSAPATKNGIPLPPGPPVRWFWESPLSSSNHVIIIIGSLDAATEIMEKEGGALVDRPRSVAFGEIVSNNMRIVTMNNGERFRRFRKAVHAHLQPKAIQVDPKHHVEHAKRFTVSVILRVLYGKSTPTSHDDPEVVRIYQNIKNLEPVSRPGSYLVDTFPILKYVPGYGRDLRKVREFESSLYRDQLGHVKDEMSRNEAGPSFSKMLLENAGDHRMSYEEIAYLSGTLFATASASTSVAITTMIMTAACHPEAQARVQEELDLVVGTDRGEPVRCSVYMYDLTPPLAPTFEDWNSLPQLHAFISEVLRWRPVALLGISHRATKDIIWRGQVIPAGAKVLGCHWAISRDPVAYPDPEKFDPQRWVDTNGQLRTDMWFYAYGFGRRVCPGLHLANQAIYINLALLLWSFRIVQRPDAPIDMDSFTGALLSHPPPFEAEFVPRIGDERLRDMMNMLVVGM